MSPKRKQSKVETGYTPQKSFTAAGASRVEFVRGSAVLRFATLLDSRRPLAQYADDWQTGFASTSPGTGVGGRTSLTESGPSDAALARMLADGHGPELAELCRGVVERIGRLVGELAGLSSDVRRLLPLDHPVAEMLARHGQTRHTGAGTCQRCSETVTGGAGIVTVDNEPVEDKLAAAYCPACYSAWRKSGLDRGAFNATWTAEKAARRARLRTATGGVDVGIVSAGHTTHTENVVMIPGSSQPVRPDTDPPAA